MHILISNLSGAVDLAQLNEAIPHEEGTNVFEDLTFESCNPGGFTVASFVLHRPITEYWPDLIYKNRIIIGEGEVVVWEGYIDQVIRSIRPDSFQVNCLGWCSRLGELGTTTDINVGGGTYKLSTFINSVVLADAALVAESSIIAGTISTSDWAYNSGTVFSFAPYTSYSDATEELNKGNNFNYGVWTDKKLNFTAKTSTINWLVKTEDCSDLTISPDSETFCNRLYTTWMEGGLYPLHRTDNNTTSQGLYGIIEKSLSLPGKKHANDAAQIATTYINEMSVLRASAEFTCSRIYDANGTEVPLYLVRGGDNVQIVDYLSTEETLVAISDIATFQIKSPQYDHKNASLKITPSDFIPSTETRIGQLEATGY